jgi:hypothetical protein
MQIERSRASTTAEMKQQGSYRKGRRRKEPLWLCWRLINERCGVGGFSHSAPCETQALSVNKAVVLTSPPLSRDPPIFLSFPASSKSNTAQPTSSHPPLSAMKVTLKEWNAVATWRWDMPDDEVCGICRVQFDGTCPTCKFPGDDCSLRKRPPI